MTTRQSKETLSQQIADVLTTIPVSLDPEEDSQDETTAKVDTIEEYEPEGPEEQERTLGDFRKLNVDLLSDVDKRYTGRKSSRRDLTTDSEGSASEEDPIGDQSDIEEESDSGEESSDYEDIKNEEVQEEGNFRQFRDTDSSLQVHKGLCVKNQLKIWEDLLEMRIQLQKSLVAANKMPQGDKYKEIEKNSGGEFASKVADTKQNLCVLLDKLLLLQNLLHKQYPETKTICNKTNLNDEDEEIPSETEDESEAPNEEEPPEKRLRLEDYEQAINSQHDTYKDYRNKTIKKWHEKTRLATLRTAENTHSILNHIEHTLSNREKLIKRTQLKRSEYQIVGEENSQDEHNNEIFDDDDFYHQLLRELIEVKSADLTDPVQLGRQWVRLQNLRSKMKRKIDTRATKGRKIRYAVHTKLVNFMAPIEVNPWTDEAKTELYNSLFGKKIFTLQNVKLQ